MKLNITIFIFCLFSLYGYSQETNKEASTTTYILVRHAEKDLSNPENKNPDLTEEGISRANRLVKILKDIHIDMVYSTDYKRTLQTATPIAKDRNIEIELYDPKKSYDKTFQEQTLGKTTVIVGHSNSTPTFVNKIIGQKKYSGIDEKDYNKLFIISLQKDVITDMMLNFD
ncbi:phosphoglycerate mutase family protein [Aquimarina litoralis]|uniref:Phosphoglycerate mutase family protein n=1 Tax=Aquimarina litoralis TaxID=584605 RepID=A0ABN1IR36_9FLAO